MAYADVAFAEIGVESKHYLDVPDPSDVLPVGNIISYSGSAFRIALAAQTTDIVVGVCTMRFKDGNSAWMKRIKYGRFAFFLEDANDELAANRFLIARAVTGTTISVDAAATGPICGIVDEFRPTALGVAGRAICHFSPVLAQSLNLGMSLPEA